MFNKTQRSSFKYWFAHWCAFQMTALNLGIWKFQYLLHDIEKPWLLKWYRLFHNNEEAYKKVQSFHRKRNKHHVTYWTIRGFDRKYLDKLNFDAMLIDWECSRHTKEAGQLTAYETLNNIVSKLKHGKYDYMIDNYIISPLPADIEYFETAMLNKINMLNLK